MKFILGILCGFVLGLVTATAYLAGAQLVPFDAPLGQQLQGQWQESYLSMQRDLERREAQTYSPYTSLPDALSLLSDGPADQAGPARHAGSDTPRCSHTERNVLKVRT